MSTILKMRKMLIFGVMLLWISRTWMIKLPLSTTTCPPSLSNCTCSWVPATREFTTNCSNAGLKSIPHDIPTMTTNLLLDGNHFGVIKNYSFANLSNITLINLSYSDIYYMESDAFVNLSRLGVLILRGNSLNSVNGSFSNNVFYPLRNSLKIIDIRNNLKIGSENHFDYPTEALTCLTSLEELKMDCISGSVLPQRFDKLSNLRIIDFSDGLQALTIPDDMFNSVAKLNIEVIRFINVKIGLITGNVFSSLKFLKILDLTNNENIKDKAVDIAKGLRNTSIEELYLNKTLLGVTNSADDVIRNLNGTNIKKLSLDWNEIMPLSAVFSKNVPTLEVLTLRHNAIYERFDLMIDILKIRELRHLDISYQQVNLDTTHRFQMYRYGMSRNLSKMCLADEACPIVFPKNLEWFAASHNGVHFTQVPEAVFMNNGTLKYADVSNNGIQTFLKPAFCAPHVVSTVETVDVSNCALQCVNKTFFQYCSWALKHFNFAQNELGLQKGKCNPNPERDFLTFIEPLATLESLDISNNHISGLFNDSFYGLKSLKELKVSDNKLSHWAPNISHMIHLEMLDLSYNNFHTLNETTTLALDQIESNAQYRTTAHVSLNLTGNQLSCTCNNLPFLNWLYSTHITLLDFKDYICVYQNGETVKMSSGFQKILSDLEYSCSDNIWFILSILSLSIYFIIVTLTTTAYGKRHYLRYWALKLRMRQERLDALLGKQTGYQYDAFVSCSSEGVRWVKKYLLPNLEVEDTQFKFCVAQRDFLVGTTILDNIMNSISNSRKTILLISTSFISSEWCNEELLLSHQESLSRGYNMIICIFMPEMDVSERHLPARINMLRNQVTCIKWSHDPVVQRVFWLQLKRALLSNTDKL